MLIGLGDSVLSPVFPALASELFGGPGFSTIYGTLYAVICLGLAAGAWSAGEIFDATASYAGALWLALGLEVLTPILVLDRRAPSPESGPAHALTDSFDSDSDFRQRHAAE